MRIDPGAFGAGKSQICQLPDWTRIETNGESGYVLQQALAAKPLMDDGLSLVRSNPPVCAGVCWSVWPRFFLLFVLALTGVQEDRPGALYAEGVERQSAGDYDQAVELLSQAAALDRDVPDYRYHLALAYLKVERPKEAARELESTLGMMGLRRETRVKEPTVLVQTAVAYLRMGNFKAARLRIENALERDEALVDAHYVMGLIVKEEGDEEAAAKHFETVLEIDRDHRAANMALAEWLEKIRPSSRGRTCATRRTVRTTISRFCSHSEAFRTVSAT